VTTAPTKILIVGKHGQVARSLAAALPSAGISVVQVGRPEVDLLESQSVMDAVLRYRPNIVINAAAYTAVDKAEDEPDVAEAVNAIGAETVAKAAGAVGAVIVHFSTDYVFDGSKRGPYVEADIGAPTGIYGRTKLAGENLVAAANPNHVILRTAWVFSPFGSNFVKTILRLSKERPELRVVDDQHGNPTYAKDLADLVQRLVAKFTTRAPEPQHFGIFHAVNSGSTTWYRFAQAIIEASAHRGAVGTIVHPISTKDYPTKARRPAFSILSTDKLHSVYGIRLRSWQEALADCLDELSSPLVNPAENRPTSP
jgi:dTDP-4-dehydrorhamnose reductase